MKMSLTSSGFYNFEPNCVYEKDGDLCDELNDEDHRMVYHVRYVDGELLGDSEQYGQSTPVRYVKVDDPPEDLPYQYLPTEIYVPDSEQTRLERLRQYASYDRSRTDGYRDEYVQGGRVPDILKTYQY